MTNKKSVKKIEINFPNKFFYPVLIVLTVFLVAVGVNAFGTNDPPTFGHTLGELEASCNGFLFGSTNSNIWSCSPQPTDCDGPGQYLRFSTDSNQFLCVNPPPSCIPTDDNNFFYTTSRGDEYGYDHNCDGFEEKQFTGTNGAITTCKQEPISCPVDVQGQKGWVGSTEAPCGTTADYVTVFGVGGCEFDHQECNPTGTVSTTTQACR